METSLSFSIVWLEALAAHTVFSSSRSESGRVCECSMFAAILVSRAQNFIFRFFLAITDCAKVMLNERALHKWCMDIEVFFIVFQSFSSDRLYGFLCINEIMHRTSDLLNFMCVFSRSYFIVVCVVTVVASSSTSSLAFRLSNANELVWRPTHDTLSRNADAEVFFRSVLHTRQTSYRINCVVKR